MSRITIVVLFEFYCCLIFEIINIFESSFGTIWIEELVKYTNSEKMYEVIK